MEAYSRSIVLAGNAASAGHPDTTPCRAHPARAFPFPATLRFRSEGKDSRGIAASMLPGSGIEWHLPASGRSARGPILPHCWRWGWGVRDGSRAPRGPPGGQTPARPGRSPPQPAAGTASSCGRRERGNPNARVTGPCRSRREAWPNAARGSRSGAGTGKGPDRHRERRQPPRGSCPCRARRERIVTRMRGDRVRAPGATKGRD